MVLSIVVGGRHFWLFRLWQVANIYIIYRAWWNMADQRKHRLLCNISILIRFFVVNTVLRDGILMNFDDLPGDV